jgi:TonB family protein
MTMYFKKSLTSGKRAVLLFSAAALLLCSASAFAEEPICRSKGGAIKVVYPDVARKMKISGTVRLQLQLTPTGAVREVKILGGNPVLATAAQQAVKQAKFEGDFCVMNFEFKD